MTKWVILLLSGFILSPFYSQGQLQNWSTSQDFLQCHCIKKGGTLGKKTNDIYFFTVLENQVMEMKGKKYTKINSNFLMSDSYMAWEGNEVFLSNESMVDFSGKYVEGKFLDFGVGIGEKWLMSDSSIYRDRTVILQRKIYNAQVNDTLFSYFMDYIPRVADSHRLTSLLVSKKRGFLALEFTKEHAMHSICFPDYLRKSIQEYLKTKTD